MKSLLSAKRDLSMTALIPAAILLFLILTGSASGDPAVLPVMALISCVCGAVFLLKRAETPVGSRPLILSVSAYVAFFAVSTLWAASRRLALQENSKYLTAYAVFLAALYLLSKSRERHRFLAETISWTALACGVLSVDAASSGILIRGFRAVTGCFTQNYAQAGSGFPSRLATIFENANTYAGLLSVALLLSLWLLLTAPNRKRRAAACILTAGLSFCYLLAFSMGSLFFFGLSCLLFLLLAGKQRLSLFFIMLENALAAMLCAGLAMPGLPRHPGGSLLPLAVLLLGMFAVTAIDLFLRDRIVDRLEGHGKAIAVVLLALVVLSAGYLAAALQLSAPYDVKPSDTLKRGVDLAPGTYTLTVEADQPAQVNISYRNETALITNRDLDLADGTTEAPCTFTVPENSRIVFIRVLGETRVTQVSYEGPETGELVLRYRLLPNFIASRIQALGAPGTAIQRTGFWQDGLKLFQRSPVIGNGPGCVESQIASVRSYDYDIRQLHNHFVQMLADGGVIGLICYLAILITAVLTALRGFRAGSPVGAVLLACCLQMFGQSITDVTWSAGNCLPVFFIILAMIASCGETNTKAKQDRALRIVGAVLLLLFCVPLTGHLYAEARLRRNPDLDTLKANTKIDVFDADSDRISYIMSSIGSQDPAVREQADEYARTLSQVSSNTIPIYLAQYHLAMGDYAAALAEFDHAIQCSAGDADIWNQIFMLFRQVLLSPQAPDSVLQDLNCYIERLHQWNQAALVPHELTPESALFLMTVSQIDPADPGLFAQAEKEILLDTSAASDLNDDRIPDICLDVIGKAEWEEDHTARVLAPTVFQYQFRPSSGHYRLEIVCDDPTAISDLTCAGQEFALTYQEDAAVWEITLQSGSAEDLTSLSFSAEPGTVISRLVFQKI